MFHLLVHWIACVHAYLYYMKPFTCKYTWAVLFFSCLYHRQCQACVKTVYLFIFFLYLQEPSACWRWRCNYKALLIASSEAPSLMLFLRIVERWLWWGVRETVSWRCFGSLYLPVSSSSTTTTTWDASCSFVMAASLVYRQCWHAPHIGHVFWTWLEVGVVFVGSSCSSKIP